jgi:thiamine-phosphate diphosphorylase
MRPFDPTLYLITDERLSRGRSSVEIARAAIDGGATAIQLRDKHLSAREQYTIGLRLRDLTRTMGVALICNDRIDLALAIDADGVHLGQDDLSLDTARAILPPDRFVGISAGNADEFAAGDGARADYLGVGPFAATASKADAGAAIGAAGVRVVRGLTNRPIVAIGGITRDLIPAAIAAGANGVAVISAIVGAEDPRAAARALREAVEAARRIA